MRTPRAEFVGEITSRHVPGQDTLLLSAAVMDLDLDNASIDELMGFTEGASAAETDAVIAAFNPVVFARLVKRSSDRDIRRLLESDQRKAILDQIMVGIVDAFRPDKAGDQRAVVHWKILDRPDGGYDLYEQLIGDGACTVSDDPQHDPDTELRARPVDFAKLICGFTGATMALARGKVKVRGDLNIARRYDSWFDKPRI